MQGCQKPVIEVILSKLGMTPHCGHEGRHPEVSRKSHAIQKLPGSAVQAGVGETKVARGACEETKADHPMLQVRNMEIMKEPFIAHPSVPFRINDGSWVHVNLHDAKSFKEQDAWAEMSF